MKKTVFLVVLMAMCSSLSVSAQAQDELSGMSRGARIALLYIPNRLLDFVDIFRANIGVGPGWGLNARATRYLTAASSEYDTIRFGMRGREMPRYEEAIDEECFGLFALQLGDFDRDPFEVAATVHAAYIGAELGGDLNEVGDFILGIFMYDYQEDDMGPNVWE